MQRVALLRLNTLAQLQAAAAVAAAAQKAFDSSAAVRRHPLALAAVRGASTPNAVCVNSRAPAPTPAPISTPRPCPLPPCPLPTHLHHDRVHLPLLQLWWAAEQQVQQLEGSLQVVGGGTALDVTPVRAFRGGQADTATWGDFVKGGVGFCGREREREGGVRRPATGTG